MARQRTVLNSRIRATKDDLRSQKSWSQSQTKAAKEAERSNREYQRAVEQAMKAVDQAKKAEEKEKTRLYIESRSAQIDLQNEQLEQSIQDLQNILLSTLSVDDYFDLDKLKERPQRPAFNPGNLTKIEKPPTLSSYLPPELSGVKKFVPGAQKQYDQEVAVAKARYKKDLEIYSLLKATHEANLADAKAKYEREIVELKRRIAEQHAEIDEFKQDFEAGVPEAIVNYFTLVLENSLYPEGFPQHARLAFVPESKQLVVEYDLPSFEIVPDVASYKYIKSKDEITIVPRPITQRKELYASITSQVTLRTIHELFEADRIGHLETIVFNGYVESIDKGTGRPMRTCVVTVRTTRDIFTNLDLSKVDPALCLKTLNASVSKSPSELAPVRPVLEFNMVDSRFIEETDVLSTLDQRPNLMELTPSEFESLITNLFEKMGLETRLTQASRDGGVDCVAYDPRPIFGGKVVIQAKRYKHTVGVSAVRDLYGTMQNEGASKGILVTTSGYGKAAFEFADGKPLELLSGSNLLYLLEEHAAIKAKIEPPKDWKDPQPDSSNEV